jgi:peptidoglycan/xylan/chitin deacetylase (PgdA/CDA1 family)
MNDPKLLLYHDLTARGTIPADRAAARFDAQLTAITSAGFRFRTMIDYLAGELGPRDVVVTFDDALRSFLDVAWPVLQRHSVAPTLYAVSGFAARMDADRTLMSWDDIYRVAEQGVTIGCHAATHVPLDQIRAEQMHAEITDSLAAFAEQGFRPTTIAYPFGRHNAEVKAAAEAAGFAAAFTVMKGGADRFEIRRRSLTGSENSAQLRLVLSEGFFGIRDTARALLPRRFRKQEQPVAASRWGARALGLSEFETNAE